MMIELMLFFYYVSFVQSIINWFHFPHNRLEFSSPIPNTSTLISVPKYGNVF